MKIYADMLFAINFSMDFISLFITAMLMKRKIHKKRILLSATLGGAYGVFEVLISLNIMISIIIALLVSILMCFVAYYEKSIKRFVGIYVVYWGISACLGGFMSILYSFLNKLLFEYIKNYNYETVYTGARFFIVVALAIIISVIFGRLFSEEKNITSAVIDVIFKERNFKINALCDSGNLLTEPITGKSVILVSLETDLGKEIEKESDIFKRYIPYETIDGTGMLRGVLPTQIKINDAERTALIAPVDKKSFGGYDACIPTTLV